MALLMCAFLRTKGTPARLRCEFAAYFGDGWEDHWVCEYWDSQETRWRLSDAQLDGVIAAARNVTFDPANVPRHSSLPQGRRGCAVGQGTMTPTGTAMAAREAFGSCM